MRTMVRKAAKRLQRGPVVKWRFTGPTPDRILVAPPDLRMADAHLAQEMLEGRYSLSGKTLNAGQQSPFSAEPPSLQWETALHQFRWLRHLNAIDSEQAGALARKLAGEWIRLHGTQLRAAGFTPDTTARRCIAWMQHSTVLLKNAELGFYEAFLKSLAMQLRYLRAVTGSLDTGEAKLRCRIALAFGTLCLPSSPGRLATATRNLERELKLQILPDGVHVSRNPEAVLELLTDLLPLRQTFASQSEAPPHELVAAIDRMMPALRFFRHRDGALANFNGSGYALQERIAAVLRYDDSGGSPLSAAPHGGYQRFAEGGVTVIADTGGLPLRGAEEAAHGGCLSFEMSSGRHRYVVNCGTDWLSPAQYRQIARTTAAHSTATVQDSSSIRFLPIDDAPDGRDAEVLSGPHKVLVKRADSEDGPGFEASHDGFARRFGIVHRRSVQMTHGGSIIMGCDTFVGTDGYPVRNAAKDLVTIRFHLSPQVHVIANDDGQIMLMADQDDTWVFTCNEVAPATSESLFFAGISGPQKTRMIVLEFHAGDVPEVNWQLTRTGLGAWSR